MDKYGIYMQHIANLVEDKSYPQKERNKFKHWYQKWTCSKIPILVSLATEVLTPAKILSKTFQSEDVDSVETEGLIKQTKQSLSRIQRKEFDQLPTVKSFFERVKEEDGKHTFQDVVLTRFEQSKESAKKKLRNLG